MRPVDDEGFKTSQKSKAKFYVIRNPREREHKDKSSMSLRPDDLELSDAEVIESLIAFAKCAVDHYGYIVRMNDASDAGSYASGSVPSFAEVADPEERENWTLWTNSSVGAEPREFIRNVHEVNFLSDFYLNLDVFGQTLEQWINADESRGELSPLNSKAKMWIPPPEHIGTIREELFRSGVLYYYAFFKYFVGDNPWKRDFSKPWKCPDEIPRIFHRDYRHAIDPPLRA